MNHNPTLTLTDGTILSFNQIHATYFPHLVAYAKHFFNDNGACEMLAQDALIALWEHPERFPDLPAVRTFLYTIVQRKALNILQRIKIEQNYLDSHQHEESTTVCDIPFPEEEFEHFNRLFKAIEQLPEQYRAICQLILEDKNNQEISERLNISPNTVKYHKKNIYKLLRQKLDRHP